MAQAGTIKSISGTVTALGADGQVRTLGVGDIVFENEIIQTGIGGSVVITLADNKEISLGENAEMMLDETVIASVESGDASVSDVDALQAALEAGENIDDIEEETAAGEGDQFEFLASYYGGDDTAGQVGSYLLDAAEDEGGLDAADEEGAGNTDPVAADDAIIMDEDGVFSGQLPAATDMDGDNVTYSVGTPPVNGILVINPDGSYTYTPNPNYNGPDNFTYVINDGKGGTATYTVEITVNPVNDVPVLTGDEGNVIEDVVTSVNGQVTIDDIDEGESFFRPSELTGEYGSFTLDANGNWTYSLNNGNPAVQALPAGVTLTESFEVVSLDGTATETVTITITGTNDVPVITGEASGDVVEDGEALFTSGKLDIADVDTGESFFQPAEQAGEYGSFVMDENGNWTYSLNNENPAVQALPAGVTLTETFEVISLDGTATETVTITITGTNDVPVITGEAEGSVYEDGEVLFTSGKLDIADVDTGESFFEPSEQTGIYGSFVMDADGNWTYQLNNENGDVQALPAEATLTESFVVYSVDGTASETVTITITGTNDVPVISGENSGDVVEDVTLTATGKLDIADIDTGESFFQPSQQSGQYGSFVMDENGNWTYELNNQAVQSLPAGATLTEEFEVISLDGTATETVTITITGTNDVPEISGDKKGTVYEDGEVLFTSGKLDIADIDENESYFRVQEATAGKYGTFSIDEEGNWVYDLNNDAVQFLPQGAILKESFTVVSLDGTATQKVTVTIVGTNDVPVISGKDEGFVTEDQNVIFGKLVTGGILTIDDADLLQDFFKPEIVKGEYGTFTMGPLGVWTYTATNGSSAIQSLPEGATLTEKFTVTSIDGSATHEITVTITGTNDVPVISGQDSGSVTEDSNFLLLSTNGKLDIVDVDTGESSFKPSAQIGKYGAFVMDEDGNWKYTALNLHPSIQSLPAGATLTEEFTVESFDGTATETVTVTIVGTNDVPLMIGDFKGAVVEDVKLGTSGRIFVLDVDTGESSVRPVEDAEGTYGKFTIDADGKWTYELDNDNIIVQSLPKGAKVTDTFEVTSFDGTVTKTVTVTITGTNDQPEVKDVSKVVFEDGRVIDGQLEVTDVDTGDTHTFALVDDAPAGFTLNPDGSWSFDPDNDAYDSLAKGDVLVLKIPYTATDSSGAFNAESEEGMITIKVIGTNDRPEVEDVEFGVYENGAKYTGQLDVTDVDEGDNHIFLPAGKLPAGFILLPNGEYSFNPSNPAYESLREGQEIILTVKYVAVDDSFSLNSISETGTITITVTGTNDQPWVKNVSKTVYEGGDEISGQVKAYDIDNGDTHTFALVDDAPAGFTFNSDGTWSFDPADPAYDSLAKGEILTLKIPFTATDNSGAANAESEEGFITIKVKGTNDAPVAVNDEVEVDEDGSVTFGVLGNDYDVDGDSISIKDFTQPEHGTVTLNQDGTFTYVPNENYNGDDSFTYTIKDQHGETSTATVSVTVNPVNDAPVAVDDFVEVDEDGSKTFNVLSNDYDVDGDDISIDDFTQPENGTVTLNQDGTFTYVPNENYNGDDSFTYTITDPSGETSTATVNITVNPVNDAPVAVDDGRPNFSFSGLSGNYYAVSTEFNGLSGSTYNNDNGYLIDNLTEFKHIVDTTDPAATFEATKIWYGYGNNNGVSTGNSLAEFLNHDGASLEYVNGQTDTPEGGFHISGKIWIEAGTYNFKVYADDGYDILIDGESVAKFVNNQSPATHVHDSFTIEESGWYDIDMYWWDQGGEYVFQPMISDDGGLTYTLLTNEGTYTTAEDTAIDFTAADLLDNDFDIDGDELTIIGVGNAVNGEVVLNDDGSVTFTPDADYNGPAQFEYTISDGNGGEDTATVYLVVSPVNDAPVAENDFAETNENESVIINVLDNDTDVDGDSLSIHTYDGTSENGGTVTLNQDGTFSYTPLQGFSGTDTFTYTVTDGNGGFDTATVTVEVANTNDVPVAQNDYVSVVEGSSTTQTVNLVLVIDTSTSMNDKVGDLTRLQIAKAALQNLIDKYGDSLGSVMLVDFNDSAKLYTINGEKWLTAEQAKTAINGLTTKNYTDYDHAIEVVRTSYTDAPDADKTYVYFLSDGEPMGSDGGNDNSISSGERTTWTNFLSTSGIDEVFAIGVGSGISNTQQLGMVAWTSDADNNHSGNVIMVTNDNQLSAILEGTVNLNTVEGNLLDNDDFGDDGAGSPQLVSVEYNGVTVEFDSSTTEHTFDLGEAGKVTIYSDGRYEYTSGTDVADDVTAEIKYVIQDADGETSEATLTLTTTDSSEVFAADNANHAVISTVSAPESSTTSTLLSNFTLDDGNSGSSVTSAGYKYSNNFTVAEGQSASVSFSYTISNINSGEAFVYQVQKLVNGQWTNVQTVSATANGSATTNTLSAGTYRLYFEANDKTSSRNFTANVNNIKLTTVTEGYEYLVAAMVSGNVLTDANNYLGSDDQWGAVDDMGSEGAAFTVFNGTDYVSPDAAGTTIIGDYGTLVIKADGSYTYTPVANADSIGQTETFEYKLTQPDGDSDTAHLVISIGDAPLHVVHGTDGADTITFDPTADLIDAGAGYDTLVIGGGELDFSNIADVVRNIEEIDLTSGDNTLNNLTLHDVLAITDADNELVIRGNEGDFVTIDNSDGAFSVDNGHLVVNDGSANISFEGGVTFEVTDTHIKVTFTDDGTEIGG